MAKVLPKLEAVQKEFNASQGGKKNVSLADLIVLGGGAAIEEAAKKAGQTLKIPFAPGRTDASQAQTDVHSFAVLEPKADGFRNYPGKSQLRPAEELLVDRAQLLKLTAPQMTVLVGGLRVLGANFADSKHGVFTTRPETLTNDFFINLLDMKTTWNARNDDGVLRAATVRRVKRSGRPREWTLSSVRIRSFAPSRRSMPAPMRRKRS